MFPRRAGFRRVFCVPLFTRNCKDRFDVHVGTKTVLTFRTECHVSARALGFRLSAHTLNLFGGARFSLFDFFFNTRKIGLFLSFGRHFFAQSAASFFFSGIGDGDGDAARPLLIRAGFSQWAR